MSIHDYGDPGIEWGEANAANDDGQQVIDAERAAEEARQAEADKAVRLLDDQVHAAQEAAHAALATLKDLTERLYDIELAESTRAGVILEGLTGALRALSSARKETAARLKQLTDEELHAELDLLRDENARLRARLAEPQPGTSGEVMPLWRS